MGVADWVSIPYMMINLKHVCQGHQVDGFFEKNDCCTVVQFINDVLKRHKVGHLVLLLSAPDVLKVGQSLVNVIIHR